MWFKGYILLSSNLEPWFYIIIIFIYWDIVALQQCAIFCCTMKWISYLYTYIQSFKPVNPKGNRPWIFIGRTDAKAEAPILLPPDAKSRLTGKHPDAGKDWRQKEKGWQSMRWFESITDSMDMNMSKLWEIVKDRGAWHAAVCEVAKSLTWLSNWTATIPNNKNDNGRKFSGLKKKSKLMTSQAK